MTDEDLKTYLEGWVKDYCNDTFDDGLPSGVVIFIDQAMTYLKNKSGVQSEHLGDYSITLSLDFPESLKKLLVPYRRLRML